MSQAVNSNLFLYADDSGLMLQHKDIEKESKRYETMALEIFGIGLLIRNEVFILVKKRTNRFPLQVNVKSKI